MGVSMHGMIQKEKNILLYSEINGYFDDLCLFIQKNKKKKVY